MHTFRYALFLLLLSAGLSLIAAASTRAADEAAYNKAYKFMQADRYRDAIPLFERYVAGLPANDHYDLQAAHLNAGECYYQTNAYAEAARHLDAAIALSPAVAHDRGKNSAHVPALVYFHDADAHLEIGQYQQAIAFATRGFGADPEIRIGSQIAFGYRIRGAAHFYLRQYSSAISDLNSAIKIEPDSYSAHLLRGEALRETRDYSGSLNEFRAAYHVDRQATPYCEAALTLILQRRDQDAQDALSTCYKMDRSLRAQYDGRLRRLLATRGR